MVHMSLKLLRIFSCIVVCLIESVLILTNQLSGLRCLLLSPQLACNLDEGGTKNSIWCLLGDRKKVKSVEIDKGQGELRRYCEVEKGQNPELGYNIVHYFW